MEFKVYIIYSAAFDIYYKGVTSDLHKRINDHNLGFSKFTKNKGPWILVFFRSFADKKDAATGLSIFHPGGLRVVRHL